MTQAQEIKLLKHEIERYKEVVTYLNATIDNLVKERDSHFNTCNDLMERLEKYKTHDETIENMQRSYNMLKAQYDELKPKYENIKNSGYDLRQITDQYEISCKLRAEQELENASLKNSLRILKDAFVWNHLRLNDELVHIVTTESNHFNNISKKK